MPRSLYATDTDLTAENLLRLPAEFGCPVWVYDAQIIRRQIAQLSQFDVVRFAQKACSNIHILRLMREQGVKVDSVSLGEIERALAAGYDPQQHPEDIVFTADLIDEATLERVKALQIPVNAGSVDMLSQLGKSLQAIASGCASTRALVTATAKNQHRRRKQQTRDLVQPSAGGAGSDASLSAPAGGDPHAYWLRG
jgi:diaminopimelate decarboxylase